jgi:hypothetical protein
MARAASGKGPRKKSRNKKRKAKVSRYGAKSYGLGPYGSRRKPLASPGTANGVGKSGDTRASTGTVPLAGEGSLTVDMAVVSAHDRMLARAAELEATIAQLLPLLPSTPGIGHNNPPPLSAADLDDIKVDIALLKAQPPPASAEATGIASKFAERAGRVLAWAGAIIFTEAAKPIAKDAVEWLWLKIGPQLTDAATGIMHWVLLGY